MKKLQIKLKNNEKVYFLGDFHLGAPDKDQSNRRERNIISFLDSIKSDVKELFLMGDLFDFWFEYKEVIPKGFVRFFGKIAEISDKGTNIHLIVGNHDMWVKNYFTEELNINIHHKLINVIINDKSLLVGHGDGLGKGDISYKIFKTIFSNNLIKFLCQWIHPDLGIKIGKFFSKDNKIQENNNQSINNNNNNNNRLYDYCKKIENQSHNDYYVFGHTHLPCEKTIGKNSKYINVGDCIKDCSYFYCCSKCL